MASYQYSLPTNPATPRAPSGNPAIAQAPPTYCRPAYQTYAPTAGAPGVCGPAACGPTACWPTACAPVACGPAAACGPVTVAPVPVPVPGPIVHTHSEHHHAVPVEVPVEVPVGVPVHHGTFVSHNVTPVLNHFHTRTDNFLGRMTPNQEPYKGSAFNAMRKNKKYYYRDPMGQKYSYKQDPNGHYYGFNTYPF